LKEPDVNATLHLVGVANYGPRQEELVNAVLAQLQPDFVALELPLRVGTGPAGGGAMLPYPAFVQILMDHVPWLQGTGQQGPAGLSDESSTPSEQQLEDMRVELHAVGAEASSAQGIGHDIYDPFEATGYFAGAELAVRPQQIAQASELFGILPGLEYATAAQWALERELQLLCLDASLRLQQAWVSNLVSRFELREADLPRQLQAEWQAALEVVPREHMVWDMQLGALVSELMAQAAQEPQIGSRQKGSNNGQEDSSDGQEGTSNRREESSDRQENSSNRQGGSSTSSRGGPCESEGNGECSSSRSSSSSSIDGSKASCDAGRNVFGPDQAMTAYKVCKATAAAMLGPEATQKAVQRQAMLQPLKFAHFERRALHMATQLLECTRRNAALASQALRRRRMASRKSDDSSHASFVLGLGSSSPNSTSTETDATAPSASGSTASSSEGNSTVDAPPFKVAAVIGRQYVPMILRLWNDSNSDLWRGDVPRTFAPSVIEPDFDELDPDVEKGGSRPVGQVAKVLGADGRLQQQQQQQQ